jgi:NADPH-dependent curcumin reductase CurA
LSDVNRRLLLAKRPSGLVQNDDFDLVEEEVPEPGEGEAVVQTTWLSLDPTNRTWMNDAPGYLPPVQIGDVMRGYGLGKVVASNDPNLSEGQLVQGMTGWQDYQTFGPSNPATKLPDEVAGMPPGALLGALGMTGVTAYFGITDVAEVKEGETVVVSAASGAVGSVAGQIAKILGAYTVGIAGGPEKCAWITQELGFDAAVDYKADDWREKLKEATPDRIDVDFENVGGEIMDRVFARLNIGARIALCGLISGYNDEGGPVGPRNFSALIAARAKVQGFLILDYLDRYGEAARQLGAWMQEGKLKHRDTVAEGLELAPEHLNRLFDGDKMGKLVVHVSD